MFRSTTLQFVKFKFKPKIALNHIFANDIKPITFAENNNTIKDIGADSNKPEKIIISEINFKDPGIAENNKTMLNNENPKFGVYANTPDISVIKRVL